MITDTDTALTDTLLSLADTKLVLGNWCVATVFNGRSIGDFATLLAIAGTSLGAARSLYRLLEDHGFNYSWLERERSSDAIASMDLLDSAPRSWADLMVTIFLAESATSAFARRLVDSGDRRLSVQAGLLSKDSAFHETYCLGWIKVLAVHERDQLLDALRVRVPLALRWLAAGGDAGTPAFAPAVDKLAAAAGVAVPAAAAPMPADWDARRRRSGALPPGLWENVRFKDVELVH
jgi:1,2-phenylacetyl-CoA epoxidase catalytic subunit